MQTCKNAPPELVSSLFWDLLTRAFRGVTLGVATLAWHGLGFDPGCPREKALGILRYLREKEEPVNRSKLLLVNGARINAATRNILLERLMAEDLVQVEGKMVRATRFEEFVAALHCRPGLPEADDYRALVSEDGKASA